MYCDGGNWYGGMEAELEERSKRLGTPSFAKDLRDTSNESLYRNKSKFTGENLRDVTHIANKLRAYLMNYVKAQSICTYSLSFILRLIPRSESNSSPYKEEYEVKSECDNEILFVVDAADLRALESVLTTQDLLHVNITYPHREVGRLLIEWDF